MKILKITKILALPLVVGMTVSAAYCQTYSSGIVGYANISIYAGTNFIANQFDNSEGNTLDTLFQAGAVPEGTLFSEWDPATGQLLPFSTYDTDTGWSRDYSLSYGQGGFLIAPENFSVTFTGSVLTGDPGVVQSGPNTIFYPALVTGSGTFFLSCVDPLQSANFYDVVGRNPQNGESVTILDAQTQIETTTTFDNGVWSNGDPDINVGESAFYNLETVPEPSMACLGTLALLAVAWRRRRSGVRE